MAARSKALNVVAASGTAASTEVKSYSLPPAKGDCTYIDAENPAELIKKLHEEAKVI